MGTPLTTVSWKRRANWRKISRLRTSQTQRNRIRNQPLSRRRSLQHNQARSPLHNRVQSRLRSRVRNRRHNRARKRLHLPRRNPPRVKTVSSPALRLRKTPARSLLFPWKTTLLCSKSPRTTCLWATDWHGRGCMFSSRAVALRSISLTHREFLTTPLQRMTRTIPIPLTRICPTPAAAIPPRSWHRCAPSRRRPSRKRNSRSRWPRRTTRSCRPK